MNKIKVHVPDGNGIWFTSQHNVGIMLAGKPYPIIPHIGYFYLDEAFLLSHTDLHVYILHMLT